MLNVDTQVLLCAVIGSLRPRETRLLRTHSWSICAIVFWEIAKLAQIDRIAVDLDDAEVVRALSRLHVWPLTREVARASTRDSTFMEILRMSSSLRLRLFTTFRCLPTTACSSAQSWYRSLLEAPLARPQRIFSFRFLSLETGGGRGTGIQHSPRTPTQYSEEFERSLWQRVCALRGSELRPRRAATSGMVCSLHRGVRARTLMACEHLAKTCAKCGLRATARPRSLSCAMRWCRSLPRDEVLIKVAVAGINFADIMARLGLYPGRAEASPASSDTR